MNKTLIAILLLISVSFLVFPFVFYYGNQIMIVISDSMIPTLNPHDIIIVENTKIEDVMVGDIIAFDSHIEGMGIIAHRVTEKIVQHNIIQFKTKGDNVPELDSWTVQDADFIGRVVDSVPGVGIFLIGPVRYTLVAIIIIISIFYLKEFTRKSKT